MKNYMMNTKKRFMPLLTVLLTVCLVLNAVTPLTVLATETTTAPTEVTGDSQESEETDLKAENTYDATVHYIVASSSSYTEYIYEYSGSDPLLAMYCRGTLYGSYLKSNTGSNVFFYTLSDDGTSAVSPKMTHVKTIKHDYSTDTTTETEVNTVQTLANLKNYNSYSVYIEGEYETLAYSQSRVIDGEVTTLSITEAQMACYYLKHNSTMTNWSAFSFDFTSRAVFDYDYVTYLDKTDLNIMDVVISDGTLSHGGTIYSDDEVYRGGIRVKFCYYSTCGNYSLTTYYNYWLPLDADTYELNFADIKSIPVGDRTYELDRIYIEPVVRYDVTRASLTGDNMVFYTEELEEAGCFEKGGDPIVSSDSTDKSDNSNTGSTGDPSTGDSDDDGQSKVYPEAPTEDEWDETEHGFMENALHRLKNLADYLYSIVLSLVGFPEFINDMIDSSDNMADFFGEFFDELTSSVREMFVPEEDFTDKYIQVFNDSFPIVASSKQFMADFKERLGELGDTAPSLTVPFSKIWQGRAAMYDVEMSFAWFEPYRENFHVLVSGIMWAVFCYRQYMGIKNMLNATGGVVSMFGGAD